MAGMLVLRELQNFVAVAECLSVSTAAKAVNLSQPALSRQIQALEKRLGVKLFERIGKRLMLTAEGHDLLLHASGLLDHAQAFVNRASALERGQVGLLRVGASPQTIAGLISPVMRTFSRLYPNVQLAISEAPHDGLVQLAETGGVHLAITGRSDSSQLIGRELFLARLFAILPKGHRLSGAKRVELKDIADDRFLVLRRGFLTRQLLDRACASCGVRPQIILESDSTNTLLSLANDGHGIAVVSSSAQEVHRQDSSALLTMNGQTISDMVQAVWHPSRHRPGSLAAFVDLLIEQAALRDRAHNTTMNGD